MGSYSVLLVSPDTELRHLVESILIDMPVEVLSVTSADEARRSIMDSDPQIAIISDALPGKESLTLCDVLRKSHQREPFQIILVVNDIEQALLERAINGLIDDFYLTSAPIVGLKLRVQAAIRRLSDHVAVAQEREYYRRAARNEEELTSKALDETLQLRERFENSALHSTMDPTTGLLREAGLLREVDIEVERTVRSLNTLTGFMLSIDRGSELTRTYGSDAMNRLMGQVGRAFQHGLRKYDHSGHYGDGIILVILPGTTLDVGEHVARRFAAALDRVVSQGPQFAGRATFSIGAAQFNEGDSRDRWLGRTQASLIRARSLGGGRVEIDDRPPNAYQLWKTERRA